MGFPNFSNLAICRLRVSCVFLLAHCQRISSRRSSAPDQPVGIRVIARPWCVVGKLLTTSLERSSLRCPGNRRREYPYPITITSRGSTGIRAAALESAGALAKAPFWGS